MDPSRIGAGHKREIMHIRTELEIINSSEVGNIAKDATTTIGKWSENLNKALKQWNKDAEQLQQALEDAKSTLKQTAKAKVGNFVQHYQEDKVAYQKLQNCFNHLPPGSHVVETVKGSTLDEWRQLVSDLGLPSSVIEYNAQLGQSGCVMSKGQMINLYDVVTSAINDYTIKGSISFDPNKPHPKFAKLQETVAQLKSDQTKDMFHVMACLSCMRMNEQQESSAMEMLSNMVDSMMSAIQSSQ